MTRAQKQQQLGFLARMLRRVKGVFSTSPKGTELENYIASARMTGAAPNEIQGLWQAWGSIQAAKIAGKFAVFTVGVAGTGVWVYRSRANHSLKVKANNLKNDFKAILDEAMEIKSKMQNVLEIADAAVNRVEVLDAENTRLQAENAILKKENATLKAREQKRFFDQICEKQADASLFGSRGQTRVVCIEKSVESREKACSQ